MMICYIVLEAVVRENSSFIILMHRKRRMPGNLKPWDILKYSSHKRRRKYYGD